LAEGLVRRVIIDLLTHRSDDLNFFNERVDKNLLQRLNGYLAKPFVRMSYTEAIDVWTVSPSIICRF
jgi:asparaginyl-tRNA synthetase